MADKNGIAPPAYDDTQEVRGNEFGTKGHHFGNEYDSHDARTPRNVRVGHSDGGVAIDPIPTTHAPGEDLTDDNGRRGYVDQRTGEVHGSGADAGGGAGGADIDPDTAGGSNDLPLAGATPDRAG